MRDIEIKGDVQTTIPSETEKGSIRHQISNALTPILVLSGALKQKNLAPEINEALHVVYDSAKRIQHLIRHLEPQVMTPDSTPTDYFSNTMLLDFGNKKIYN